MAGVSALSDWGTYGLPSQLQSTFLPAPYNFFNGEVADDNLIDSGDIVHIYVCFPETRTWRRLCRFISISGDNPEL